jgi:hypothetical protein
MEKDGVLIGITPDGLDLIDLLHLNDDPALVVRRHYLDIFDLKNKLPADSDVEALIVRVFGFPDDMPDLRTKRPPGGNQRRGSEQSCYFALKERGELPAVY